MPLFNPIANFNVPEQDSSGLLAWNFDPMVGFSNITPNNNRIYLQTVNIRQPTTVSTGYLFVQTQGTAPAIGYMGVYDPNGNLVTSGSSSTWMTAASNTYATTALTPATLNVGTYYVAVNGSASTMSKLGCGTTIKSISNIVNNRALDGGVSAGTLVLPSTVSTTTTANATPFWVALA